MLPSSGIVLANTVTTVVLMHGGPVTVTALQAINTTAAVAYLQVFDAASTAAVTLGTTLPTWVLSSPASDVSASDRLPTGGLLFRSGVVVASTTTNTGSTGAAQHVRMGVL